MARQYAHITHKVTLKPHSVLKHDKYNRVNFEVTETSKKNLMQNSDEGYQYNGYLSPNSKRAIKKRLEVWLSAIELSKDLKSMPKGVNPDEVLPTFVTLTLPSKQIHSDQDIKKYCLERFIKWVTTPGDQVFKYGPRAGQKKSFGVQHYFWRAEAQKNGNIHFHILLDRYVPWERIREEWNKIVETLGYVSQYENMQKFFYRKGFRIRENQLKQDMKRFAAMAENAATKRRMPKNCPNAMKEVLAVTVKTGKKLPAKAIQHYAELHQREQYENGLKNGWRNPNSTDIHGIENLQSITAYVIKYVAKGPDELKPNLKPGQKLVTEEGKKYIVTYTRVEAGPNEPEYFAQDVELDRVEYVPTFTDRRLRGNIWGTDKGLKPNKGESVVDYFITSEKETRLFLEEPEPEKDLNNLQKNEVVKSDGKKRKIYLKTTQVDIFGHSRTVLHYQRDFIEQPKKEVVKNRHWNEVEENDLVRNYINELRSLADIKRLARIKAEIGPMFEAMNGEVIPLNCVSLSPSGSASSPNEAKYMRQDQILEKLSPELHRQYVGHYRNVFNYLYGNAAA